MRIVEFIVSFALLVVGFWLRAAAFTSEFVGYEVLTFTAGIVAFSVSFGLPMRRYLKA
jgi:hypothetical protein